ncbi:OLC1v1031348C1 [Oldenlandia corymbosa var. corymbosa]|uniref:OLC1v1031348C1 n=1 Tax=Oldenlandia corymbosa var. corymbosa TaxID=529605 RepID=A0AAV1CLM6_OLDCO|nr:OLC1v1031348C1 [Oldenlandia corymbosa var. corymbosa]
MGLFRRIAGFLGIGKDEAEELKGNDDDNDVVPRAVPVPNMPRKGFSVPVQVPVDRPASGPVLVPCPAGNGGVQGLRWYAKRLCIDEDGDVADEFICEAPPNKIMRAEDHLEPLPRFEVKCNTRPVKMCNLVRSENGKIQMSVESQGRLEWL